MQQLEEIWNELTEFEKSLILQFYFVAGGSKQEMTKTVYGDKFTRANYDELNSQLGILQKRVLKWIEKKNYTKNDLLECIREHLGV